jgi:hypothetical protein
MTQLQRRTETFAGTDQRWIGSREGTDTARTVTLDHDSWSSKVVNGRLKGGEPIALNTSTKKWVPYNSGGSNGTNAVSGFLLNDVPFRVDATNKPDCVAPMLDRGRIILKYLPSTVAAAATVAATAKFALIDVDAF